jgi:AhpD family alkylhydroperoxidase
MALNEGGRVGASSGQTGGHSGGHGDGRAAGGRYEQFQAFRTRLNERILNQGKPEGQGGAATIVTKRFFALDDQTYRDTSGEGGLDKKTKELLGLAASMVLRCDDCIAYHVDQCVQAGCTDRQIWETFDVALIVGGSIVIPHLRRACEFLDECRTRGS